jgi:hypothetical protein
MRVKIELNANCSDLERVLASYYNLSEPVKMISVEFDEAGDLIAMGFEVDAEDSIQICRKWDNYAFAEGLIGEAV